LTGPGWLKNYDFIGKTKLMEGYFWKHQLDAKLRGSDGKFELDKAIGPLFANTHITSRDIEGGFRPMKSLLLHAASP
jgi:hypothetical protein